MCSMLSHAIKPSSEFSWLIRNSNILAEVLYYFWLSFLIAKIWTREVNCAWQTLSFEILIRKWLGQLLIKDCSSKIINLLLFKKKNKVKIVGRVKQFNRNPCNFQIPNTCKSRKNSLPKSSHFDAFKLSSPCSNSLEPKPMYAMPSGIDRLILTIVSYVKVEGLWIT